MPTPDLRRILLPAFTVATIVFAAALPTLQGTAAAPGGGATILNPCGAVLPPNTVCEQGTITSPTSGETIVLTPSTAAGPTRLTSPTDVTGVARRESKVFIHLLLSDMVTPAQAVPTRTVANAFGTFKAQVVFPVPVQTSATTVNFYLAAYYLRDTTDMDNDSSFLQLTGAPPLRLTVEVPPPIIVEACETQFDMATLFSTDRPGVFGANLILGDTIPVRLDTEGGMAWRRLPRPPDDPGELFIFFLTEVADPIASRCNPCEWKRNDEAGKQLATYFCVTRPTGFDPLIFLSSDAPVAVRIQAEPSHGTLVGWTGPVVDGAWQVNVDPLSSREPLSYVFSKHPFASQAKTGWSIASEQLLPFTEQLLLELGYPADEVRTFIAREVAPFRLVSPALDVTLLSSAEASDVVDLLVAPAPARIERVLLRVTPTSKRHALTPPDTAPLRHRLTPGLNVREYGIF